ncbi:hypothetical protein [Streptomyces sp. NPDC001100]
MAFSLDDRALRAGSVDATARLGNLTLPDPRQAVDKICSAVRRDLTALERTTYLDGHRDTTC